MLPNNNVYGNNNFKDIDLNGLNNSKPNEQMLNSCAFKL